MRVPGLRSLFGSTNDEISQTDIVMLLTPHIVRTHELTVDDLAPMYIGTQQNVGLTGPPPLIQPPAAEDAPPAAQAARTAAGGDHDAGPAVPAAARPGHRCPRRAFRRPPGPSPAANAIHAAAGRCASRLRQAHRRRQPGTAPPRDPATAPATSPAIPAASVAQVTITAPQEFRTAGGPYTVPLAVANASRLSMITLTVTFNPAVLRVRNVQEGTFMRQGGVTASFTPRIDVGSRTRRHRRHAQRRSGRRVRLGSAGGAALRCGRPRQLADSGQRRGEQSRRRRASAAVHAGVGDGEVMP